MAEEPLTISNNDPDELSKRYAFLRELGIGRAQELAGKIWTDYNTSDPGVTILEVLAYAITDLGYRTSYDIKDLLAQDPTNPATLELRNFYTAREIMHNCPVTINDYRKLLMDVTVPNPDIDCPEIGIKNAWFEKNARPEVEIYYQSASHKLGFAPDPDKPTEPPLNLEILYDVMVELDSCDKFGDLNATRLVFDYPIEDTTDLNVQGAIIRISADFPRWDEDINFNNLLEIRNGMRNFSFEVFNLPKTYKIDASISNDPVTNEVKLILEKPGGFRYSSNEFPDAGSGLDADDPATTSYLEWQYISGIESALNTALFNSTDSILTFYQEKVALINKIIEKARTTLCANRNLCEDFVRFRSVRIEDIALCSEIELDPSSDVEEVQATIYNEISKFLNPTVFFYSLEEMLDKGKTTDEIFEGPRLQHGFVDQDELRIADRRSVIHTSDLYRIIMDVPGVLAVKNLQVANLPQDNTSNIQSQSVRWCLNLALDEGYVPRLSLARSKTTFYKGLLPFQPNVLAVEKLLDEIDDLNRSRFPENPTLDIKVPSGVYRSIDEYTSIQEDFPLVYGIGSDGLPATSDTLRKAQAKQMKGFLMGFDQLLADYLAQLSHVKDLFAMNGERDENGNYIVNRSYFTQPLFDIVPNVDPLYADKAGHKEALNRIAENDDIFSKRRNKFLDHLLARFAETFTDYTLMSYRINRAASAEELIEDKLEFLNRYPALSEGRFKGPDHCNTCETWSVDNVSGLNLRASLLSGMDPFPISALNFSPHFTIDDASTTGDGPWTFTIEEENAPNDPLLQSNPDVVYLTLDALKSVLERCVGAGSCKENYKTEDVGGDLYVHLYCHGEIIARSVEIMADEVEGDTAIDVFVALLSKEFYNNPESNRKNLACFFSNYFEKTLVGFDMTGKYPQYTFNLALFDLPFGNPLGQELMNVSGISAFDNQATLVKIVAADATTNTVTIDGYYSEYFAPGDPFYFLRSELYQLVSTTIQTIGDDTEIVYDAVTDTTTFKLDALDEVASPPAIPNLGVVLIGTTDEGCERTADRIMFNIARAGLERANYSLGLDGSDYRFKLRVAAFGEEPFEVLSKESDFNANVISRWFSGFTSAEVIYNGGSSTQAITWTGIAADQALIKLDFVDVVVPAMVNGVLRLTFTDTVSALDLSAHTFTLSGTDFAGYLEPGDTIVLNGTVSNDGSYTVNKAEVSGSNSVITVDENIPANQVTGTFTFAKDWTISTADDSDTLNLKLELLGGGGPAAIQQMIDFLTAKFFSHEGMHIVDHILLRPKNVDLGFVDISEQPLTGTVSGGTAIFDVITDIKEYSLLNNTICLDKDMLGVLIASDDQLEIIDSAFNNGTYTILSWEINELDQLCIVLQEKLVEDCVCDGNVILKKRLEIESVDPVTNEIIFKPLTPYYDLTGVVPFLNNLKDDGLMGTFGMTDEEFNVDLSTYAPFLNTGIYDKDPIACNVKAVINAGVDEVLQNPIFTTVRIHITDDCGTDCTFLLIEPANIPSVNAFSLIQSFNSIENLGPHPISSTFLAPQDPGLNLPPEADPILMRINITIDNGTDVFDRDMFALTDCYVGQNCDAITTEGTCFEIIDSLPAGIIDGEYKVGEIGPEATPGAIPIGQVRESTPPILFSLPNPPPGCDNCQTLDPYSCILSVIVPYWQGRILNQAFRSFLEQTIRRETPAHIALSVCFIDCDKMGEFEMKYKKWLLENAKPNRNDAAYHAALADLIDILERLRNVYPPGTLHDCQEGGDDFSSAIILNNSVIGNV